MSPITIYTARRILTMNPMQPEASAVAVRDGRILAVGEIETMRGWGEPHVDERFADKVLMPGLVEGHCHVLEGGMWRYTYVGYYDRVGPDGRRWPGLKSIDAVLERLHEAEARLPDTDAPLLAWGFDPIYFGGPRMVREQLDRVSAARPVVVLHTSVHLVNVNTLVLEQAGITADSPVDGIVLGDDGRPTGELQEFAAMFLAFTVAGGEFFSGTESMEAVWNFARVANLAGVTTATDLFNELSDTTIANFRTAAADPEYPLRLVATQAGAGVDPRQIVDKVHALRKTNTDKLYFGIIKLITDGTLQGFTARVRWPGFYNGIENGIWVIAPQQIQELVQAYNAAGIQLHIHTNGDEASTVTLDALEAALNHAPRHDHRHTLQHCQLMDAALLRRLRALGGCANLFANHLYYWGDQHYGISIGPDRANRMDAIGTTQRLGIPYGIHSDAPVTPISPLFTAWCAVNRLTASGRVLGETERITVPEALHAITLGAAYTLKLDHLIGSIEVGKFADFAVLDDDPLAVAPEDLKDVRVRGTVLGGKVFEARSPAP